jgi:yeast amino acid transporter
MGVPFPLIAAAGIMSFWVPATQVSPAVWISVFLIPQITFNFFNVRKYGEIEFWLTSIKVLTCVGLIILGILLAMGASAETPLLGTDSNHHLIQCLNATTDNCVSPPGFICTFPLLQALILDWRQIGMESFLASGAVGRLAGFWSCCCQACFAYLGAEILGITANEVERPRETVPKAVRRVAKRLTFYYVGTIFILGVNLSARDPVLGYYISNPDSSYQGPFVLMAQRANIPGLDHLLNAIALISAVSLGNANLYVTVWVPMSIKFNC